MKNVDTCVTPNGSFLYGIHKPSYKVRNLRGQTNIQPLGSLTGKSEDSKTEVIDNSRNYPGEDIEVGNADWIFEIPNAFAFRGRTFIDKEWADSSAQNPGKIHLNEKEPVSLSNLLDQENINRSFLDKLPAPLHLALATCSSDPEDLIRLAHLSCDIIMADSVPSGLKYIADKNRGYSPAIHNHDLFEAVANNPHLPDSYKIVMVIRPGAQGGSEIVGDYSENNDTHVFEYLRRNSYIPGGHYAANMADDAIRYSIKNLGQADMHGLRHLYYQRSYIRMAEKIKLEVAQKKETFSQQELEELRLNILETLKDLDYSPATLWGWNFGFDFAPSLYRLHASHQQIHQQYALIPDRVESFEKGCHTNSGELLPYSLGDQVTKQIETYKQKYKSDFFTDYLRAIQTNSRLDDRNDLESSLIVWEDEHALVFVPKAQTSQWELQLMTLPDTKGKFPGNIFECDLATRHSLDAGILAAQKALSGLGAKMVTSIEYSKRVNTNTSINQPLLYAFLPRLPQSPGAFSEAQLRFINGHYPEDFATVCRKKLNNQLDGC